VEENAEDAWFILPAAGDESFDWRKFTVEVLGPLEYDPSPDAAPRPSPFSEGLFRVELSVPDAFPSAPPAIKFVTKLFHPLVNLDDGRLCADFMTSQWNSTGFGLRDVLVIVRRMLAQPHLNNDLCVNIAAKELLGDIDKFDSHVKDFTAKYAPQ
jgi:ubiquitin-protein ligase